jgi:hypothetical protein
VFLHRSRVLAQEPCSHSSLLSVGEKAKGTDISKHADAEKQAITQDAEKGALAVPLVQRGDVHGGSPWWW